MGTMPAFFVGHCIETLYGTASLPSFVPRIIATMKINFKSFGARRALEHWLTSFELSIKLRKFRMLSPGTLGVTHFLHLGISINFAHSSRGRSLRILLLAPAIAFKYDLGIPLSNGRLRPPIYILKFQET